MIASIKENDELQMNPIATANSIRLPRLSSSDGWLTMNL